MKPIIEVNHVWKEYQKGIDRKYKSLRDTISQIPELLWGNKTEKFWALEDIDFKVEAGESIGIIGRNGAGKSTLLKILSRITPPTKGEVIMRGRVASLLEVGTGFHPELTGKENIFFNGSILGMKHREIKQKFDEIVDFSGVQSFIDTPLKHYSSGMQMRLAFSVAAHLDSEILLIDEVLAVGDADFQKKCIGKMDEVSKGEGKTILFVSHDLSLIQKLCYKAILINKGTITSKGNINDSINDYLTNIKKKISWNEEINTNEFPISIINAEIIKTVHASISTFSNLKIRIDLDSTQNAMSSTCKIDVGINNEFGKRVAWMSTFDFKYTNQRYIEFEIEEIPLRAGMYDCNIYCEINGSTAFWYKNVLTFNIHQSNLAHHTPKTQSDFELKYLVHQR